MSLLSDDLKEIAQGDIENFEDPEESLDDGSSFAPHQPLHESERRPLRDH